jgi:hypothetical protein
MMRIIRVVLIVLLYNVYHVLSHTTSCLYETSCIFGCTAPQVITVNTAKFGGSYYDFRNNRNEACELDASTQVRPFSHQLTTASFQINLATMGEDPCSGQAKDLMFRVDYSCGDPVGPPPSPPPPPPCSPGQEYPACNRCGNIYY